MAVYRQDIDFQSLFRKLGHQLEEIRVRALDNINSKLEHQLICEQDIIHERHLIIRLLEWFNFTPCPKRDDVLHLLCRLSQHWGAAELIQAVGGIEFLSQLREDVEASLQPIIDQILENVMRLPDAKGQEHAPECIYHKPANSAAWGNTVTSVDENHPSHASLATGASASHVSSVPSVTAEKLGRHDNISEGYFQGRGESEAPPGPQPDLRPEQNPVGFKMSTFPWLPLTRTDRYVLQSTNRSLQSREVSVLTSACEFLSDVAFQDFPAEIFLQRPLIVRSLLGLLGLGPPGDPRLVVCAARTLSHLCTCLQTRIRFYQDPVLYTPKQDFSSSSPSTFSLTGSSSSHSVHSSDTRPSLIGWSDRRHRGDGRDGDSSDSSRDSSVGPEPPPHGTGREMDVDDTNNLQYLQLSLPQFAATVLLQSLQSLRTTQQSVATELLRLGFEAWKILVVVVAEDLWNSGSESAKEQVSKLKSCMETCSSLLHYHHHNRPNKANMAAGSEDRGDPAHHRHVYLGVASLLSHLLHLVPHDKAVDIVPEQLLDTLGALLFDESLAVSYPQCHGVLTHFAQLLDLDGYRHFCQAVHVRQSMHDTCRFVLQAKAKTLPAEEAVALADSAVTSLPYHLHLPFISEFVTFFSHLSSRQSTDKALLSHCTGTLLKLLSHPLTQVRQHTYFVLLSTIQLCLNPASEAANSNVTGHLGAKFVLNTDVLYEVVCFGLADSDNKVSSVAMDVLYHLLQSPLLLGDLLWGELITALLKSLPILQSYTDLKSRFGRRVWAMLDPAVTSDHLCLMDKLRGNLRLMLSADAGLREEAMKRLCWFLAHESGSKDRHPSISEMDVQHLSTLFIVDTPRYLDDDSSRSVFQVEGMKQVYDIFTASPVDPGVKKSAAEQLAIMMQDPHLHAAFRQSGGVEVILSILHEAMDCPLHGDQQTSCLGLVPACVRMLRHLLHHDYTLRHSLTHDPNIYYDLVRVSVMLVRDESLSYQVAHTLTLLLFDEVAKFDISSSQKGQVDKSFSLPVVVTKRYRLPFRPTIHHTVSPSAILPPPEHDALKLPPPREMLRVAWNVAWCGGLDSLLHLLKTGGSKLDEIRDFSKAMVLTETDRTMLLSSGLRWSLQEGVYAVANAVSHDHVVSGLNGLLAVMATIPSAECVSLFNQLSWSDVIHRFLQVTPSSPQDESLLLEVLRFINTVISITSHLPDQIMQWLAQRLYDSTGPLMALLNRTPASGEGKDSADTSLTGKRSLNKLSLQFITTFISRLPYRLHTRVNVSQSRGDLIHKLLFHLNISDAPHFYNLAALEGILVCMMHLTARYVSRPGWSEEGSEMEPVALCSHVLNCLLEVVSAFHIGRGSTSMSYIGRGVTKAATLCLRHLAHEMVIHTENKEWAKDWLYSRQGADAEAEPGLNWMLTLWAYRDAEVRAAGLGIAVALTSSEVGRMLVTSNCRHIPGGIWGAAFSVLLDPSECSAVRQQAALLLVNLTSQTIPTVTLDSSSPSSPSVWQGPVVMDVESNVSLVGLSALLALLHHSHFYQQLSAMLASFFSSPVLQPVLVTTHVPLHSLHSSHSSLSSSVCSTDGHKEQREDSARATDQDPVTTSARSTGESARSATSQQDSHVSATTSSSGTTHTGLQLDSSSSSSSRGGEAGGDGADLEGMNSVVTPCLVAAVTQLLGNLVVMAPEDTFSSLAAHNVLDTLLSMIDTTLLQDLCRQLLSGPHRSSSLLTLRDLLRMYDAVVSLLRTCVVLNSPTRMALLANKGALKAIASLMLLQCDSGGDVVMECRQLWLSVVKLLCSLLQTQSAAALHTLSQVLAPFWIDFCDALVHLMETHSKETAELFTVVTSLLSLLLAEEGKQVAREPQRCSDSTTLTYLLDVSKAKRRQAADKDGERTHFTTGASLAKVLVNAFELTSGSKVGSKGKVSGQTLHVINTLKSLLAVSQSAKFATLDMGLVEMLIENMKQIHAQLSLDSVQLNKPSRRKDDGVLQELIFTVNILRNLICGNEQAKLACRHSGLGGVVHKLWAWCVQEPSLMSPILSLLINFTARCPAAATSLASAASGMVSPNASRQQLISNSLVLAITKAAQREVERELAPSSSGSQHLKLFFTLLTSLSLSSECRNLIWKSNILQDFSKLSPNRSRKSRSRQLLDALWMELAVGLSFSTDGQQMLLRIDECLTVLLDFMENGFASPHCQECAMLVMRNMCCHAANKPKLLANENVIPCCVDVVESSDNSRLQTLAASALWALAYNNHKAKVAMKGVNIEVRMRACLKSVQSLGHSMEDVQCSENIQAVISTITT